MKNKIVLVIMSMVMILSLSMNGMAERSSDWTRGLSNSGFNNVNIISQTESNGIINVELDLFDSNNALPIRLNILTKNNVIPTKTLYLHPGTGLSFTSDFLSNPTPIYNLVNKGYLVVGISPRESQATLDMNMNILRYNDLSNHTRDLSEVINVVQSIINNPYEVGGHSGGALIAIDYASQVGNSKHKFKAVRNIDMVGQYPSGSVERSNSISTISAIDQLTESGQYVNFDNAGLQQLVSAAQLYPDADSGVPRGILPGNFTYKGLLYFSLIYTNQLPGMYTSITGLSGSWYLKQGFCNGVYNFNEDPTLDTFSLTHTNINTIYSATANIGSGVYSLSYERDILSVWTGGNQVNWNNVRVPVYWINTEYGFGSTDIVSLIPRANVNFGVVSGYGHADPTFSDTSVQDFWTILFP